MARRVLETLQDERLAPVAPAIVELRKARRDLAEAIQRHQATEQELMEALEVYVARWGPDARLDVDTLEIYEEVAE